MHIVLVLVTVKPEMLDGVRAALLHNARESVAHDPGCLRFDVSQQQDDPTRWVLHEVYDAPDAHAAHRQSPHFLAYDAVAARALIEKTVIRASGSTSREPGPSSAIVASKGSDGWRQASARSVRRNPKRTWDLARTGRWCRQSFAL